MKFIFHTIIQIFNIYFTYIIVISKKNKLDNSIYIYIFFFYAIYKSKKYKNWYI